MALTSTTTVDLAGQTQVLSFYESSSLVDQISYGSNQITYAAISTFNLSKADCLLYYSYVNAFNNSLIVNFPITANSINAALPLSQFDITLSSSGAEHIVYTQLSGSSVVYTTNYVPLAQAASFAARISPVTVTLQEFFTGLYFKTKFNVQIALN